MRRLTTSMAVALCILLCASLAATQQTTTASTSVPNLIRYSGTLKDAQGLALASPTPVGVTFAIYKQQDGGAAVWQETQNVTPDSAGQYNVILGSTTATGLPDDLFSQQEQRWLAVQVQGQDEQARVLLVSVPYAFKAHEAETLGGLPASAFVKAPPANGTGSETASATNTANTSAPGGVRTNTKGVSGKNKPPQICTPTPGSIVLWDNDGSLCPSMFSQVLDPNNPNFGHIGIGVANPSEPLDVQGVISTYTWYDIYEQRVVSVGSPASAASTNLYLGFLAGGPDNPAADTGTLNTFAGKEAGFNNTTGSAGAFFGFRAGYHNTTASSNTLVGYQAGFKNSRGASNTIVGRSAGFNNTAGGTSIFGYAAGYNNTADNNSFFGNQAGNANTSGLNNTFMGNQAGLANVRGNSNTFLGYFAGQNNNDPNGLNCCNTLVGAFTGQGGTGNVAGGNSYFGYRAGQVTTTGGKNTFMGWTSGVATTTGSFNSFFGDQSGQNNIGGSYNTFLGISSAGTNFTTGDYNTCVGAFACDQENNVSNNIEIGNAGGLGTGSGSILIGTAGTHVNQTYVAGIYNVPIVNNNPMSVVIDSTGHLGTTALAGGNVTGPGNCATNFLTKWVGGNNVNCSHVWETPTGTFFVGINTTTPGDQLEVNGDIGAAWDTSSFQLRLPSGLATILSAYGDRDTYLGFSATPLNCANSTGLCEQNTFAGANAGSSNTNGSYNSFFGSAAGNADTTGSSNTFLGQGTGVHTTTAGNNTFVGTSAGFSNFTGSNNAYLGDSTGGSNEQGNNNIFLGSNAGRRSATAGGSSNIYLAHPGCNAVGGCAESNTIRIGFQYSNLINDCGNTPSPCGQKFVFMEPVLLNPSPSNSGNVVIDVTTGQLGFMGSSRRFKEQIADMGDSSSKLFQLRPVTFLYKAEYEKGNRIPQYGLIAEEVAAVYPDLVAYDKDGQPLTVKYQVLAPMLLNELQKEHKVVLEQQDELQTQLQQISAQRQEIDGLKRQLQQQNASLQERLTRLESYVETQMKTASDNPPRVMPGANGALQ